MSDVRFQTNTRPKRKPPTGERSGRSPRRLFGIVHYVTGAKQSFLVIPPSSGISVGDRISFYVEEGGISFRVEDQGMYAVFRQTPTAKSMRCSLCPELQDFAYHTTRNIVVRTVPGGWLVPFDQFN